MAPRRGRLNRVRVSNQLGGAPPPRKRGREPGGPNEARAPHDHFLARALPPNVSVVTRETLR